MSGYCTESDQQDGRSGQKCCKCICCSPLVSADGELWLTATAQHGEKGSSLTSLTQERSKLKTQSAVSTYSI